VADDWEVADDRVLLLEAVANRDHEEHGKDGQQDPRESHAR
jgi:hypothetical protein